METRIVEEIDRVPTSYAQVTYDEFWVAAITLKDVSALQQDDIGSLRKAFIDAANSYDGVSGRTELNDAGDRKYGSYDFWAVRPVYKDVNDKSSFEWANVAAYPIGIGN